MQLLLGAVVLALLAAGSAAAADEAKPRSPQAQRMSDCSAEARAKTLTGDERRRFMSECLKGHAGPQAVTPPAGKTAPAKPGVDAQRGGQAERMKACTQEAATKNLQGDGRRHFMSECLKAEKKS